MKDEDVMNTPERRALEKANKATLVSYAIYSGVPVASIGVAIFIGLLVNNFWAGALAGIVFCILGYFIVVEVAPRIHKKIKDG